jgi:type I restriction enzyme S subunit
MANDWSTTTLGDCADFFSGGTPRRSNADYWGGTIPWFSAKDLKSFYLSDSEDHVTEEGVEAGSRLMPAGTILLLVRGMTLHNDVPIGVLTREAAFNQDIKALRARSGVQQSFLAHWLVSQKPHLLSTVHAAGHGTGVLATDRLHALELELPPPNEQAAIADVFDLIEDKIEQNRRTGRALERLVRAIFKAWFVDFEPVKAKAAGASGFPGMPPGAFAALPDRFTESPRGTLPEGWKIVDVYELANVVYGAPFASKLFNATGAGKPLIRIRDLQTHSPSVFTTERHAKGTLIRPGDIIVGMDGEFRLHYWTGPEAWLNQRLCSFQPLPSVPTMYLGEALRAPLDYVERSETATTVIHLGKYDIDRFELLRPDKVSLAAFDSITSPMLKLIVQSATESSRLAILRDYLLPRLLSGRVRVRPSQAKVTA